MTTGRVFRLSPCVIALAALCGVHPVAHAAHVYAAVNGAIDVYDVAANGALTLKQGLQSAPVIAMVTTPSGRFLYTTDGTWLYHYASQNNGTIQQWSAPVQACDPEGTGDLGMHPVTGDYLYTISSTICAYRTDDADGHLTKASSGHVMTDASRLVVHPNGQSIAALGDPAGSAFVMVRTNPDGTVAQRMPQVYSEQASLLTFGATADARFFYVGYKPDLDPAATSGTIRVLAPQKDSTLKPVGSQTVDLLPVNAVSGRHQIVSVRGTFLAQTAGGKGSHLDIYSVANDGSMKQVATAAIEVYAMAAGSGAWSSNLWVATNDGVVSYKVNADGTVARIGKVLVSGAKVLTFGVK